MSQSWAGEVSNSFNNNINSFNIYYLISADDKAEILTWISPLEPWIRHDSIRAHRIEHVGDWLLRTPEYRSWFNGFRGGESENSTLFCYGNPGVGKTYFT